MKWTGTYQIFHNMSFWQSHDYQGQLLLEIYNKPERQLQEQTISAATLQWKHEQK